MTKIISIANQKGGVGKTTTAINLAGCLGQMGRRVLLIDMDPQGNAGRGLGFDVTAQKKTIYDVLMGTDSIEEVRQATTFDNLFVLCSNLKLASLEASLYTNPTAKPFNLLKQALAASNEIYDYIIIDCPPSLGLLSINSMAASDSVLIPVQCEYFAMEAVAAILSSIANIQKDLNPTLTIEGFLLTMFDASTQLGNEVAKEIRTLFKENAFYTSIPRNQSVAEAQAHHMPVSYFRATSKGGIAYANLAKEIIAHESR